MKRVLNAALFLLIMLQAISCSKDKGSPNSPNNPPTGNNYVPEIAYHRNDPNNQSLHNRFCLMNAETANNIILIPNFFWEGSPIVWRKDKSEIFYFAEYKYVAAVKTDGSATRRVSADLPATSDFNHYYSSNDNLSISPDQTLLVNARGDGINLIKSDGTGLTIIVRGKVIYTLFSPTSNEIIAIALGAQGTPFTQNGLYLVDISGQIKKQFAIPILPAECSWSPDGRKISCWGGSFSVNAYIIDVTTSSITSYQNMSNLEWSPDGKEIVFNMGTGVTLSKMNADGTNRQQIAINGLNAKWSPDGKHLAFGGDGWLTISDVAGSNQRRIAELYHFPFAWRPL